MVKDQQLICGNVALAHERLAGGCRFKKEVPTAEDETALSA